MSGNSNMNQVLKGVVRDHRLPADYNYHYTQPYNSRAFLKNVKRFLVSRQITKQNITIPLYMLFVRNQMCKMFRVSCHYMSLDTLYMLTRSLVAILNSYKVKTGFIEKATTQCNTQPMLTLTISGTRDFTAGQATQAVVQTLHLNAPGKT